MQITEHNVISLHVYGIRTRVLPRAAEARHLATNLDNVIVSHYRGARKHIAWHTQCEAQMRAEAVRRRVSWTRLRSSWPDALGRHPKCSRPSRTEWLLSYTRVSARIPHGQSPGRSAFTSYPCRTRQSPLITARNKRRKVVRTLLKQRRRWIVKLSCSDLSRLAGDALQCEYCTSPFVAFAKHTGMR